MQFNFMIYDVCYAGAAGLVLFAINISFVTILTLFKPNIIGFSFVKNVNKDR